MKNRIFILSAIIVAFSAVAGAQELPREKLESYRIAFFTKKLNLTPQEAQKFWPVYNEFQDKKNQVQLEKVKLNRSFNQNESSLSDRELSDLADKYIALEMQNASIIQDYHRKFKEVLPPVKVIRLYQAENQYRLQLLQELKQNQQLRNNIRRGAGSGDIEQLY
jgi:hypothetical protein